MYIALGILILLFILNVLNARTREHLRTRTPGDWLLDGIGLLHQGIVAGLMIGFILFQVLSYLDMSLPFLPEWSGLWGILFYILVFDYVFYWSHRLFHHHKLFAIHLTHHTTERMDVLSTSRNSLWQPFLYPHVWLISLIYILSHDKWSVVIASQIMGVFDYWNHSNLHLPSKISSYLQKLFITPLSHEWHHSRHKYNKNFGNIFSIWDKIHGTYYLNHTSPRHMGLRSKSSWWQKLLTMNGQYK